MKYLLIWLAAFLTLASCTQDHTLTVTVTNPTDIDRNGEMVEISMNQVTETLQLDDTAQIFIVDADGMEAPYQITYDNKLIFPVSLKAHGSRTYTIRQGVPTEQSTYVYGSVYPERLDDLAWENDLAAYRLYGPGAAARKQQLYGYDIWTKCIPEPVVEERYKNELEGEKYLRNDSLRKADPEGVRQQYQSLSYHVNHGDGLDCYAVGPTLGGGTAALMEDGRIVYPYCYREVEILDNGPLRFTVALTYPPFALGRDSCVVEHRLITLDKGSHLNKTVISYENLTDPAPLVAGIVLHPGNPDAYASAEKDIIAYEDPTETADGSNGHIFVGAVFPHPAEEAGTVPFTAEESRKLRGHALGHVLARSPYTPLSDFTYYWGSAWSLAGMTSMSAWIDYLKTFSGKVRQPLEVIVASH